MGAPCRTAAVRPAKNICDDIAVPNIPARRASIRRASSHSDGGRSSSAFVAEPSGVIFARVPRKGDSRSFVRRRFGDTPAARAAATENASPSDSGSGPGRRGMPPRCIDRVGRRSRSRRSAHISARATPGEEPAPRSIHHSRVTTRGFVDAVIACRDPGAAGPIVHVSQRVGTGEGKPRVVTPKRPGRSFMCHEWRHGDAQAVRRDDHTAERCGEVRRGTRGRRPASGTGTPDRPRDRCGCRPRSAGSRGRGG